MNTYVTEIKALDPVTRELKSWAGDYVEALSFEEAENWCKNNKGYLKVIGELIGEEIYEHK